MAKSPVQVTQYFPSAKAPWENGIHRLWSEKNIINIFKAILDVDTESTPVISHDGKYLIIGGYLFEGEWAEGDSYYIEIENGELKYDTDGNSVLYISDTDLSNHIGGPAQKIKIFQSSLGNIDLND